MSARPAIGVCAAASVFVLTITAGRAQQPVTFRSTTDVVLVDALVRNGSSIVKDLVPENFQIFDEGFPQEIDGLVTEQLPIDLTLVLDESGSTSEVITRFAASAREVTALLHPDDRVRLVTFATDVVETAALQPGTQALPFERLQPAGGTSLNDALFLSLIRTQRPGRRQLIVAFTDGEDTTSVLGGAGLTKAAYRAETTLHVVLSGGPMAKLGQVPMPLRLLGEAAEATGGEMHAASAFGNAVQALEKVFADFRQSYTLRYRPTRVSRTGWHAITVRIRKPGAESFVVRARRGYFAG
jgi:VWFA-related protein